MTAFIGVWAAIQLTAPADSSLIAPDLPEYSFQLITVFLCGIASFTTYLLNRRWQIHIVTSAGLVGLISGLVLNLSGFEHIHLLTAAVYCASFAGMCNRNRLRGPWMFVLVGLLSGFLFLATGPAYHLYGGKLGTIAFVAALAAKTIGEWLKPGAHDFICDD